MKTIGLLGGTGWESTAEYYKKINKEIATLLGHQHTAKIILFSIDFFELSSRIDKPNFGGIEEFLTEVAKNIENAGADCLLLCANTPHMYADQISNKISIPLIHIADATALKIQEKGMRKVGLLGTKPTMELPFYKNRLKEKFGIDVIIPSEKERDYIHKTIFGEFLNGIFDIQTKKHFLDIIRHLVTEGAEGIVLGCTEIPLLISQQDTPTALFDTLENHAKAAVDFVLTS